jgi:hypothetical protein
VAEYDLCDTHVAGSFRDVVSEGVTEQVRAHRVAYPSALPDLHDESPKRLLRSGMLPLVRLLSIDPRVTPPLGAEDIVIVLKPMDLAHDGLKQADVARVQCGSVSFGP